MEIIRELKEIPNLAIALGFFDGIHLGHQDVLNSVMETASYFNVKTAVLTFAQHPKEYLNGEKFRYILSKEDKYKVLEEIGIDYLIELDFETIHNLTADEYIKDVLVKYFSPKVIATGFNHKFGKNKSGGVFILSEHQSLYGYNYIATPPRSYYGDRVSSTLIRTYITNGEVDMAESMLGRKFFVTGTVIQGRRIGNTIGFPTANILYPDDVVKLPYGVYHAIVTLESNEQYKALVNFGVAPTISDENKEVLEAYLLDFEGDIYNQKIKVEFVNSIRPEIQFDNIDDLKTQLELDLLSIK